MNTAQQRLDADFASESFENVQAAAEILKTATPKNEDTPEFAELVKEALAVQDACNLSGVAISFGAVMQKINAIDNANEGLGTRWRASNRVTRLWIDKMHSLAGDTLTADWHDAV